MKFFFTEKIKKIAQSASDDKILQTLSELISRLCGTDVGKAEYVKRVCKPEFKEYVKMKNECND